MEEAPHPLPVVLPPARHGCLTAWLVYSIITAVAMMFIALFSPSLLARLGMQASSLSIALITLCYLADIVFAVALLRWRKWGFFGFVVTTAISVFVHMSMGMGIVRSLYGFAGIAILYGVLEIGGANKAWGRLR